jgi:preprotein translocase subunit SecA
MIGSALTKIFGSKNERVLKGIQPLVDRINSFEPDIQKLDDAGLAAKTVCNPGGSKKGDR